MMHLARKIEQAGATGYILLWLLGIPIPILILIFLLRGCTDKIQSLRQCSGSRFRGLGTDASPLHSGSRGIGERRFN